MGKEFNDGLFRIEVVKDTELSDLPKYVDACATCHTCGGSCSCHAEYDDNDNAVFKKDEEVDQKIKGNRT